MRMNAHGRIDILISLRHRHRAPKIVTMRITGANIQHRNDTSVPSPLNNIVAINVKLIAVYVAVGIDEVDNVCSFPLVSKSLSVRPSFVFHSVSPFAFRPITITAAVEGLLKTKSSDTS